MNNLLFGRRSSYASDANGQQSRGLERAYALCMNIKKTCESLALTEANELPEHWGKGPFALDDNAVFFLSSCANSYIGDNATHLWRHAYNVKNLRRCRQVRMNPKVQKTTHY